MRFYEVTVDVESGLTESFDGYMRGQHIPEILATGCFQTIRFERTGETRFRTRYEARTAEDLERYLAGHAAGFRADFMARFPAGRTASRAIWEEVQVFPPAPALTDPAPVAPHGTG